jgi:hypothetical protein
LNQDDQQRLLDLEDVAVRHRRVLLLLRQEADLRGIVHQLSSELASAKRRLTRVSAELHDMSFVELRREDLSK